MQGRVTAGFHGATGFSDRTASDQTLLIGVPPQLRERFERDGFTVIVDTKSWFDTASERAESQRKQTLTTRMLATEQRHGVAPCVANVSGDFPCQNVSLLAHLPLTQLKPVSTRGNDVWGFVDLNTGREYAFMGLRTGVAIVDVTNPTVPEQVAFANGSATTWRDIKVYQRYDATAKRWRAYAYVTADAVQDFLMVLDLSALPNGAERVDFSSDFRAAHNAYLINADYTFGLAETTDVPQLGVAGAGVQAGNYRLYSLADPRSPQLLTTSTRGYAHDLASFAVADSRKNAQCTNAVNASRCQVMADFNENTVDLWDVTNGASPQLLSSQPYTNASYVHSGWFSEDGRTLFVHDELDERDRGLNTTVRAFDVTSLAAPALIGTWSGPTRAIDHNGYAKGNRYYISNYAEGLTVLDITNPASMQRAGYFDTFPNSSVTDFVGAWGVYPFFASGTIAVGDINTGLYLLKNETLTSANGTLAVANRVAKGTEGDTVPVTITRSGGSAGAVSVQLDVLYATATAADVTANTLAVSWADGDTQPKTVNLSLATDALAEETELFFVRLKNPQGGATLNYPDTTYIYVTEAGATNKLRLLETDLRVDEVRTKALLTVTRTGSLAGTAQLSYRTLPAGTYTGFTAKQGDLSWADGDADAKIVQIDVDPAQLADGQTGTFQVEFFAPTNATLEATNGSVSTVTANVTIVGESPAPTPTPTPTPSPPGGGVSNGGSKGGGSMAWGWIAALGMLAACRRARAARSSQTAA